MRAGGANRQSSGGIMSERMRIFVSVAAVILILGTPAFWKMANAGVFGEVHFGYYGELNKTKHAIERSGCVESIDCTRHEGDWFLNGANIDIRTKSGQEMSLFFSHMDMNQVFDEPAGISVFRPTND